MTKVFMVSTSSVVVTARSFAQAVLVAGKAPMATDTSFGFTMGSHRKYCSGSSLSFVRMKMCNTISSQLLRFFSRIYRGNSRSFFRCKLSFGINDITVVFAKSFFNASDDHSSDKDFSFLGLPARLSMNSFR